MAIKKDEDYGKSRKDRVNERDQEELSPSHRSLHFFSVRPAGNVEPIVKSHNQELHDNQSRKGDLHTHL